MSLWYNASLLQLGQMVSYPLQKPYAPGSAERKALEAAISQMEQDLPFEVPCIINGEKVRSFGVMTRINPDPSLVDSDRQDREAAHAARSCTPSMHVPRGR